MEKLVYVVNAVLLLLIAGYEYNSSSDKTIIISGLAFAVLLGLNLLLGLFAWLDKRSIYRHYFYSAFGLIVTTLLLLYIW